MPTGTVVVFLPDPTSTDLLTQYDDLVEEYVVSDPQDVPDAILTRARAVQPDALLSSPVWDDLRRLRELEDSIARPEVAAVLASAGLATPS